MARLEQRPPRDRAVLVLEVGPAWADSYRVGNADVLAFVDRVFAAAARAPGGRARVVCFLTPAPDDALKPGDYTGTQGVVPTRAMNAWLSSLCRERGGRSLDAFALTLGTFSRDGTHYQTRGNSLIAQALLNLLQMPWPGEGA